MTAVDDVELNPFAYWPLTRSRIGGLGGAEASPDPSYVFHTEYRAFDAGPKTARVRLEGLMAEAGTLTVRVFRLREGEPVPVTLAGERVARLFNLAAGRRAVEVAFDAEEGTPYAIGGFVFDHTDARATGVRAEVVARAATGPQTQSRFGVRMARRVGLLTDGAPPRFAAPVSQGYSESQLDEEAFRPWVSATAGLVDEVDRWEVGYVLQVLRVYGRLMPDAAGLGLGRYSDEVAAAATAAGCRVAEVVVAPDATIGAALTAARTDAWPAGFDFLWTRRQIWDSEDVTAVRASMEALLEPLAPGGLAVHCLPSGRGGLDRNHLNRLAVEFVADGHIVAELRHGERSSPSFGLIIRKADAPDG